MQPFTHKDYICYLIKNPTKKFIFGLSDVSVEYQLDGVHQPHDKMFKDLFDNKEEVVHFLNKQLELENTEKEIKIDDIEKYKTKYVESDFKNKEADVVYKKADDNTYFLIEHQSTIDYNMAYRIYDYNADIMRSAIDLRKFTKRDYKYPCIYSFVIYTGRRKWNAKKDIIEKQNHLNKYYSSCKYKIVDINNLDEEELLNDNTLLSKVLLLEKKSNNEKELSDIIQKILKQDLNKKHIIYLSRVINSIFMDKLDVEMFNKIIKNKIERSGKDMNFIRVIEECIEDVNEKARKVKEKEEEVKEKEEEVKEKEEEVKEQKEEITKKEEKINKKEEKFNKKEEKFNQKISRIVLGMIKSKMADKEIVDLLDIDLSELLRIKQENHILV